MTIVTRQSVRTGPVQGGNPILGEAAGFYAENQLVVGDASGGLMFVAFDYTAPGGQLSGRMFTLEQVGLIGQFAAGPRGIRQSLDNFAIVNKVPHTWAQEIGTFDPTATGESVPGGTQRLSNMGVFLGQQNIGNNAATLFFSAANVLADQLRVTVSGYWWDPQSKRAPGGLRRGFGPFRA